MKKEILIFTIIALLTLSLKSQTTQLLNDTSIIYYDFIPDGYIYDDYNGFSAHHGDTFKIDINCDGINDLKFYFTFYPYYLYWTNSLNNNCEYAFFNTEFNDSLQSSLLYWSNGENNQWSMCTDKSRIAVRIKNGTDYYYGWVRALRSGHPGTYGPYVTATFYEQAFCKIPNYPFLFGQTAIDTKIPIINKLASTNIYIENSGTRIVVESNKMIKKVSIISISGVLISLQSNINSYSTNFNTTGYAHSSYFVQIQFSDLSTLTKPIVI